MAREEFSVPVVHGQVSGWLEGEGERVLALHGGPGLSYSYLDEMVEELAAGYRVERPGCVRAAIDRLAG